MNNLTLNKRKIRVWFRQYLPLSQDHLSAADTTPSLTSLFNVSFFSLLAPPRLKSFFRCIKLSPSRSFQSTLPTVVLRADWSFSKITFLRGRANIISGGRRECGGVGCVRSLKGQDVWQTRSFTYKTRKWLNLTELRWSEQHFHCAWAPQYTLIYIQTHSNNQKHN